MIMCIWSKKLQTVGQKLKSVFRLVECDGCSLLQTTRGANFLTLHGYTYRLNNRVSTTGGGITIYWKCSQCRVGRAITDYDGLGNCFWQREGTRHAPTCLPNPGRIAVEQVRQQYLAAAGDIDNILLRPSFSDRYFHRFVRLCLLINKWS